MKLSVVWKEYQDYTKTLSDNSRALAFAVVASCWILKEDQSLSSLLTGSLLSTILFLVLDFTQYAFASLRYYRFARKIEIDEWAKLDSKSDFKPEEIEVTLPPSLDSFSRIFLIVKTFFIALGSLLLVIQFIVRFIV